MPWQAWFDGTALPNPGRIGIGLRLLSPQGELTEQAIATGLNGCNNEAELRALAATLNLASASGARRLLLQGDSRVAIGQVSGGERTAVARLLPLIAAAQAALAGFDEVRLLWVPRHRNRDADRLARQALGLPPKPAPTPTGRARRR